MILLQTSIQESLGWRLYLQDAYQFAQIIGSILIVIYVIYTFLTFKQIKKQTDYQQDAYLRIVPTIVKEINTPLITGSYQIGVTGQFLPLYTENYTMKYIQNDLHTKLKGILKPIFNFDDALFEGNYYTLIMNNYGNAEVIRINIILSVEINNSKELIDKKMLKDRETHEFNFIIDEVVARNNGHIKIPLISTASFPIFKITLSGKYIDVRNKEYKINKIILENSNAHLLKVT